MKTNDVTQQGALLAQDARACLLAKIEFTSGTKYYATARWDITVGGDVYKGLDKLVTVGAIKETGRVESTGLVFTLSATDPQPEDFVSLALSENVHGRLVTIYLALFDTNYALIGSPIVDFQGEMDRLTIKEGDGQSSVDAYVESEMALLLGDGTVRFNNADHQKEYPGDRFFEYLPQMKEKIVPFPSAEAQRR